MFNTRIAPSPTGDMHMGTARTAYFNWLAARATGGAFILRIDDTDLNRNDQSKTDDILKIMDWLNLSYDKIVYQSNNIDRYNVIADSLCANNMAQKLDDGSVILNITDGSDLYKSLLSVTWKDNISGDVLITDQDLNYVKTMPLIKRDGMPTYNFASVVDDIDLNITYVIRGNDHFKNTSKQAALIHLISMINGGVSIPQYAHVGLLFSGGKKLSKRDGAASMMSYMDAGINPNAMLNFLLRIGWGPTIDDKSTAILNRDKALSLFLDGGKMKNSNANIDLNKLASFDKKYKKF